MNAVVLKYRLVIGGIYAVMLRCGQVLALSYFGAFCMTRLNSRFCWMTLLFWA